MPYTALLDANVLYPAPVRDLLLQLAVTDLFQRQQAEGVASLRNKPDSISREAWAAAVRACGLDWQNDYEMQAYCVRQTFY